MDSFGFILFESRCRSAERGQRSKFLDNLRIRLPLLEIWHMNRFFISGFNNRTFVRNSCTRIFPIIFNKINFFVAKLFSCYVRLVFLTQQKIAFIRNISASPNRKR
eukprot:Pompholyxophrys_punicea_v1_NODE_144_length_3209_cov_54.434686.p4 type:complete len:106 gc:universal NODE_144_length_3209_cov_54.434686:1090-1407(+)